MREPSHALGKSQAGRRPLGKPIRRGLVPGCRMLDLPRVTDPRGNLTFVENSRHIPFDIERVFYLYDVPGAAERGGHAHRDLQQLIIAVAGSFDVILDDGFERTRVPLRRAYKGLYVAPMVWRELANFSSGSVCLVLASAPYDEREYIRDHAAFLRAARGKT